MVCIEKFEIINDVCANLSAGLYIFDEIIFDVLGKKCKIEYQKASFSTLSDTLCIFPPLIIIFSQKSMIFQENIHPYP